MTDTLKDLEALAARHPKHANLIRTIKSQLATFARNPDSEAAGQIIAANVAQLVDAIAADRE